MSAVHSPFKSPRGEADYMAAYEAAMRLWTVPYEEIDIASRFGTTHVVACGPKHGPVLVLLHSFFMSLTVWAYNMADLSQGHRVYALDMMGQPGKSRPDQLIRNRGEMAEWLTGVLDGLGITRTHLAGWSYGGFAALNYAIYRPERLIKLVLLTPAGTFVPLAIQFYIRGTLTRLPGRFWSDRFMHWATYGPNLHNPDTRRFFDLTTEQFYLGARHFRLPATVLPTPFSDQDLGRVATPTLLLIGAQETLYDPESALDRAKQLLSDVETQLIPQAGHELPASRPETVDARVLEFLERPRST